MSTSKKPKSQTQHCLLYPVAEGWALDLGVPGALPTHFPSLQEVIPALPADLQLTVALRASRVLVERFTLPSTDPVEIRDMATLQLEKMLPYPAEETATEITILHTAESSAVVVAAVAKISDIEEEFAPLTDRGIWPATLILLAAAVAASGSSTGAVVSVFAEEKHIALVIGEAGQLGFAQTLNSGAVAWDSEISQWRLAAEIAGAPLGDATIRLEQGLESLAPALEFAFGKPPESFKIAPPLTAAASLLLPLSWEAAKAARARGVNLRKRLALAGYVYLGLILAIIGFLIVLRLRVDNVERQVKAILPETNQILASNARWDALAPALELKLHPLETLLHIYDSRPADDVLVTNFDQTPVNIAVRGEAPSIEKAYQFLEAVKAREGLPFALEHEPPSAAGDNKVQFQISGGEQ